MEISRRQFLREAAAVSVLPTVTTVDDILQRFPKKEQIGPIQETQIFLDPMRLFGEMSRFITEKCTNLGIDLDTAKAFEKFSDPNSWEGQIISKAFAKIGPQMQELYKDSKSTLAQTDLKTQVARIGDPGVSEHLPYFNIYANSIIKTYSILNSINNDVSGNCLFINLSTDLPADIYNLIEALEPMVDQSEEEARAVYRQRAENYIKGSEVLENLDPEIKDEVERLHTALPGALVGIKSIYVEDPGLGEYSPTTYGDGSFVLPQKAQSIDWVLGLTTLARIGFPHVVDASGTLYSTETLKKQIQCYYPEDVLGLARVELERFKLMQKFLRDVNAGGENIEPLLVDPDLYEKIGYYSIENKADVDMYVEYCDRLVGVLADLKKTTVYPKLGLGWFFEENGRNGESIVGFEFRIGDKGKDSGVGVYNKDLVAFMNGGDKEIFGDKEDLVKVSDFKYINANSIRSLGKLLKEINHPDVVDRYGEEVVFEMNNTVFGMMSDVKLALATGWVRAMGFGEEPTNEAGRFLYYDIFDDVVETGLGFGNVNVLRQSMSDEQLDLRVPMQRQVEEAQIRGREIREKIKTYMKRVYKTTGYSELTEAYVGGFVTLGVLEQKFRLRMWGAKVGEEDAALAHLVAA